MIKLKLLNLGYDYDTENGRFYKETSKAKVEIDIYVCEIVYSLEMDSNTINGEISYEEFDEAMGLIEEILN